MLSIQKTEVLEKEDNLHPQAWKHQTHDRSHTHTHTACCCSCKTLRAGPNHWFLYLLWSDNSERQEDTLWPGSKRKVWKLRHVTVDVCQVPDQLKPSLWEGTCFDFQAWIFLTAKKTVHPQSSSQAVAEQGTEVVFSAQTSGRFYSGICTSAKWLFSMCVCVHSAGLLLCLKFFLLLSTLTWPLTPEKTS